MNIALNKILTATDGSPGTTLAIRAATELSNKTGAELRVIHAWRGPVPRTGSEMSGT